jgi:hypothetical protein
VPQPAAVLQRVRRREEGEQQRGLVARERRGPGGRVLPGRAALEQHEGEHDEAGEARLDQRLQRLGLELGGAGEEHRHEERPPPERARRQQVEQRQGGEREPQVQQQRGVELGVPAREPRRQQRHRSREQRQALEVPGQLEAAERARHHLERGVVVVRQPEEAELRDPDQQRHETQQRDQPRLVGRRPRRGLAHGSASSASR